MTPVPDPYWYGRGPSQAEEAEWERQAEEAEYRASLCPGCGLGPEGDHSDCEEA